MNTFCKTRKLSFMGGGRGYVDRICASYDVIGFTLMAEMPARRCLHGGACVEVLARRSLHDRRCLH